MSDLKHSVVLERKFWNGWEIVRKQADDCAVVIDGLSRENIAWLNQSCKSNYRWVSND